MLWPDGMAVAFDPGVTATVAFPGFADHQVTAVDPPYSYQQRTIADAVGGALVIRDVLVKDYPIILRISLTRYVFRPMLLQ